MIKNTIHKSIKYIIYECVFFCSLNTLNILEYCFLIHDYLSLYQKNLWVGAEP